MDETFDVVVIGAGQAGLAVSYLLAEGSVPHVVLERGAVGESWRSQRWDSFCLNTPNWANGLPGMALLSDAPDAFAARDELVSYFERYTTTFNLPVRQHTPVTRLTRLPSGHYEVLTETGRLHAKAVVLATGSMSRPRVPDMAARLPPDIVSMSAGAYRHANALPDGAVVVAGSGQSGCQIAEDLVLAGRQVYLCASRVGRVPRVYRGRDIIAWWRDMGFLDVRVEDLDDPAVQFAAQPQVSGTNGGHTVSLQSLARDGVTLLGRVTAIEGGCLSLGDDLHRSMTFADEKAQTFKAAVDNWIATQGIAAEPASTDPGEPPLPDLGSSAELRTLDLGDAGVGTVIWCIGYDADWSWVEVDVFDDHGRPRHHGGVTDAPGLYFIGHPWLATRKSGILYGVAEDAGRIVEHLRLPGGR